MNSPAAFLRRQGYELLEESVHNKNQTRFLHFIAKKDGLRYFCKINKSNNVFAQQINSEAVTYFGKNPAGVRFLRPVKTEAYQDHVVHLFPFVDRPPISNESKGFRDFGVREADLDDFFKKVVSAIRFVARQKTITVNEYKRERTPQQLIWGFVRSLPQDTPYAMEFLKLLGTEGEALQQFELAVVDIQPQNMFWQKGELLIFDLEELGPRRKYYDYARFAVILWCIHDRPEYAKRFLKLVFDGNSSGSKSEKYRYIHYNLIEILLEHYGAHKKTPTRRRIKYMMQWVRKDLLHLANTT